MRIVILFLIFVFAINAIANEEVGKTQYMIFYGIESRMQENTQKETVVNNLTNISLGIGFDHYRFLFEKSYYAETTGNASLNVKRELNNYLFWGHYRKLINDYVDTFAAAGAGVYRDSVETALLNSLTKYNGDYKLLTGLGFGLGLKYKVIYTSFELRILFGDELDRQPTLGSLLKIGFVF